ncbi:MAG: chemotaxis protein CheB [Chloroflexota bacterium]|nr:chemotaxis protein CheB [Chloroflexota bacterium]
MVTRRSVTGVPKVPEDELRLPLVVVGCSADGIRALSKLVSTRPTRPPARILIAQHRDPRGAFSGVTDMAVERPEPAERHAREKEEEEHLAGQLERVAR